MSQHIVKILEAHFITHDVKHFIVEKPAGYTFIPGQGVDVAINLPGWDDKFRPFTFTCLNKNDYLEFMIKIYSDHNGVTNQLTHINSGAELILQEPFGAIQYKGAGVFIAGGSGITPFISIFRDLYNKKDLRGNRLFYSNKTSRDVILKDELEVMLKNNITYTYTREGVIGFIERRIDRNFLLEHISDFSGYFYLCGPDKFVNDIKTILLDVGANLETLVIEL